MKFKRLWGRDSWTKCTHVLPLGRVEPSSLDPDRLVGSHGREQNYKCGGAGEDMVRVDGIRERERETKQKTGKGKEWRYTVSIF